MDSIAVNYKDKGVIFYNLYTREPHAGQDQSRRHNNDQRYNFTNIPQTKTYEERVDYALQMIKDFNHVRPIMIDIFGPDCVQNGLGGSMPNSLIVIDREGILQLWQSWANVDGLREKLEEMTKVKK